MHWYWTQVIQNWFVCGGEAILVANTFIWHEPIQILFGHDLHARFCPCKHQGGYGEILTQNFSRDIPITCRMDVTDSPLIFLYQCNFWFSWKNKFKKNVVVQISNLFTIYTLGLYTFFPFWHQVISYKQTNSLLKKLINSLKAFFNKTHWEDLARQDVVA